MDMIKRVVSFIFLVMFILGTVVQFNDPDPAVWVLYYSSASLLAFMALVGANVRSGSFAHLDKAARSVAILMSLYWIISYFPTVQQDYKNKNGDIMRMVIQKDGNIKMKDEPMELAREFGGACIILMYSLVLYPLSTVAGVKDGKSKKAM
ncbi:Hypothetical protein NocV09_08400100 [Nannochloropsis oceanica]